MDAQKADNMIISRLRGPASFDLQSEFAPAGDQPTAIKELIDGIEQGERIKPVQVTPAKPSPQRM